jgi:hypothetical protein
MSILVCSAAHSIYIDDIPRNCLPPRAIEYDSRAYESIVYVIDSH